MKVGTDALLLGAFVEFTSKQKTALDIGCGTGVVALILAQRNSSIAIEALEIDEPSVRESSYNFANSAWSDRLKVYHGDLRTFRPHNKYDLLVSNPPYYTSSNPGKDLRIAQAKHIDDSFLNDFVEFCDFALNESGALWMIFPNSDLNTWLTGFEKVGLFPKNVIEIKGKEEGEVIRIIACLTRTPYLSEVKSTFHIRANNGNYSKEYIELTSELHDRDLKNA